MQQTWAALTRAKVVSDSNPSVSAAPGRYKIANALMLKAAWLCCVLGGIYFGLPALAVMFVLSFWQREFAGDRPFVIALGLIGLCLDTFWMYAGVLDYGDAAINLAPGLNTNSAAIHPSEKPYLGSHEATARKYLSVPLSSTLDCEF